MSDLTDGERPIWRTVDAPRSLRRTLSVYRAGNDDPTTIVDSRRFVRATITPDGPGTLVLTWRDDPAPVAEAGLDADAWGPGAQWLLDRVDDITGTNDHPVLVDGAHPKVEAALRAARTTRIGASGGMYHQLLPTIIAQRITAGEALRQWARLARAVGDQAPGPADLVAGLVLPPTPHSLARPAWWFHPLGIEAKRAEALRDVARHADKLWGWTALGSVGAADKLSLLRGVGPWTVGSVLGPVLGDPDAVPVGDFHFPSAVAWALAGEPRADDDRMLELLEPYRGQRGRVLWAIVTQRGKAPKRGPGRRVLPMATW